MHVLSKTEFEELPFSFKAEEVIETSSQLILIVLIVMSLSLTLIVITSIYKLVAHTINKQRLALEREQHPERFESPEERADRLTKCNNEKLRVKYEGTYKPCKFTNKLSKFNNNCSVCMENFNYRCDVVLIECGHLFHDSCIMEWFEKDIVCPKCPLCKYEVLSDKIEQIKERIEEVVR